MIANAEARRNAILREVERHRATWGEDLRRAAQQAEDVEFEISENKSRQSEKCGVTTACKTESNRANVRASTGPKTAEGRARSARNARRHALSLPVLSDPVCSQEADELAHQIAGANANAEIQELARRIAEAQIDLRRVRRMRQGFSQAQSAIPTMKLPRSWRQKQSLLPYLHESKPSCGPFYGLCSRT